MQAEKLLKIIKERRSVREFKPGKISKALVEKSLEAARWAPSGLNNQPWRFKVVGGKKKSSLAELTKYKQVIEESNQLILFFLSKKNSYDYKKDLMALGAAIQNCLLFLCARGLGACWLGEILKKGSEVEKRLKLNDELEFVGAVAVGFAKNIPPPRKRLPLSDLILR